jgi:hypothetical protein
MLNKVTDVHLNSIAKFLFVSRNYRRCIAEAGGTLPVSRHNANAMLQAVHRKESSQIQNVFVDRNEIAFCEIMCQLKTGRVKFFICNKNVVSIKND